MPESIKEQEAIVEFIDNHTDKIDNLIEKAKRSIELAKEHRTALISAAVTGKIDVRRA
jgi:type I restriction enzyme S subunit